MNSFEANQLVLEYMDSLHQLTEFWLTISFAVVVAANYAPKGLDRRFFTLIWTGYLATSIIFMINRINLTYMASTLRFEDSALPQFHPVLGVMGAAGVYLLMIIGTGGVIYYVRSIGRKRVVDGT